MRRVTTPAGRRVCDKGKTRAAAESQLDWTRVRVCVHGGAKGGAQSSMRACGGLREGGSRVSAWKVSAPDVRECLA
eukprot:6403651-Prymnesium_polylepis.1